MKVSKDNLVLKKVKKTKNGGLELKYTMSHEIGGKLFITDVTKTEDRVPHPDLLKIIDGVKEKYCSIYEFPKALQKNVTISGVSLSGTGKNEGCVIMGLIMTKLHKASALNCPRINFSHNTMGFEEDVKKEMEALKDEVYEYIFNEKQAQITMGLE